MDVYYTTEKTDGGFLRTVLALCGADGEIARGAHGKPHLKAGGLEFNLTHTLGFAAVAVSRRPVGLDAERVRPRKIDALVSRLRPSERQEDFFELWTAKEAYVKYLGGSLAELLPLLVYKKGVLYRENAPLNVFLKHFSAEGCTLCVCAAAEEPVNLVRI